MKELFAFKPGRARIRATFAAGDLDAAQRFGEIDTEAGILHGAQVNLMGEARGHGVWLGEDFIDGVVEQGNANKLGVKVRFGHPGMCSDALGTFLGRAKSFQKREVTRADGSKVYGAFADIHLADESKKSPNGDLYTWTLETATKNPDTFGQSIVFTYADYYVLDADGNTHKWTEEDGSASEDYDERRAAYKRWMKKSADGKIYALLDKLLGTDFTDSPAATDGVFSANDLAAEVESMLDEHPQIMQVLTEKPETVAQFIERYNASLAAAGKPTVCLSAVERPAGEELGKVTARLAEAEKRLGGLQAAKDREIAQLRKDAEAAQNEFNEKLTRLQADLDSARSELSVATGARENAEAALAQTREQLAAAEAARAALTGAVLAPPDAFANFKAAQEALGYVEARRQHPDLYAAFMEASGSGK